jgi:hypothetical protein
MISNINSIHMNDSTWDRILKICGIGMGAVLMWKTVKYFFGATVLFWVIAIIVTIKIISTTILGSIEMSNRHELERLRIKIELEHKDEMLVREYDLKRQEFRLQEQKQMQEQEQQINARRIEVYADIDREIAEFNARHFKNYHMLELQYKALSEFYEKDHDPSIYMNMLNLQVQMKRERPSDWVADAERERIKRNTLIAYGYMQDPMITLNPLPSAQEIKIIVPNKDEPNMLAQRFNNMINPTKIHNPHPKWQVP